MKWHSTGIILARTTSRVRCCSALPKVINLLRISAAEGFPQNPNQFFSPFSDGFILFNASRASLRRNWISQYVGKWFWQPLPAVPAEHPASRLHPLCSDELLWLHDFSVNYFHQTSLRCFKTNFQLHTRNSVNTVTCTELSKPPKTMSSATQNLLSQQKLSQLHAGMFIARRAPRPELGPGGPTTTFGLLHVYRARPYIQTDERTAMTGIRSSMCTRSSSTYKE